MGLRFYSGSPFEPEHVYVPELIPEGELLAYGNTRAVCLILEDLDQVNQEFDLGISLSGSDCALDPISADDALRLASALEIYLLDVLKQDRLDGPKFLITSVLNEPQGADR